LVRIACQPSSFASSTKASSKRERPLPAAPDSAINTALLAVREEPAHRVHVLSGPTKVGMGEIRLGDVDLLVERQRRDRTQPLHHDAGRVRTRVAIDAQAVEQEFAQRDRIDGSSSLGERGGVCQRSRRSLIERAGYAKRPVSIQ